MRVLLVANGLSHHVGAFFRRALEQLGHEYSFVDEQKYFGGVSFLHKFAFRALGRRPLAYWTFNRALLSETRRFRPQVVLAVKGAYIAPSVLGTIRTENGASLVNFATDDPFNSVNSTRDILKGFAFFDIYATPRRSNIPDLQQAGCHKVIYLPFGYDPAVHFPECPANGDEAMIWCSDMVFAGGADDDRLPYLEALAAQPNLDLHLYGGYWNRNHQLRSHWRGFAVERDYRLALGGSKIALCLVRRANRDGHVMRTFEIPACGVFMLAERTGEHLEFFEEGKEMACFSSPQELVDKACYYLAHTDERQRIAEAGYRRVIRNRHTYQDRLVELLRLANAA
jgi:spore maturation protein CgeB